MAFSDYLWLVRLIIEILKLLADLPKEELIAMANLRSVVDLPGAPRTRKPRSPAAPRAPPSNPTT